MDIGFIEAGFQIVGANEWDEFAALTYMTNLCGHPLTIHYIEGDKDKTRLDKALKKLSKKNDLGEIISYPISGTGWISGHPEYRPNKDFWFGDIRKLKGDDILDTLNMCPGELYCVMGGPPCQGFSTAGKRNIADPRNNLVYEMGRLIVELQPKTFFLENVPGILSMMDPDGIPVLDKFYLMLQDGGFGKWETIKKSIEHQARAAAAVRSISKKSKKDDEKEEEICSEATEEPPKADASLDRWS